MAPNTDEKRVLTFDDLDEQTALELPDRELMCYGGCSPLTVNACVSINVSVGLFGGGCSTSCSG